MHTHSSTWRRPQLKEIVILLLVSSAGLSAFLLASYLNGHLGFPLDDSWIHQTYARNLAELGEFSFIPGKPSAGSTSPLWTGVLAVGYFLRLPYLPWTFVMGWLSLGLVAWLGMSLARRLSAKESPGGLWVAVFLASEWHLLWAAVSGMETLLYSVVILGLFVLLFSQRVPWFWSGILVGASIWLRPDGITLLGPIAWVIFFSIKDWKNRLKAQTISIAGMLIVIAPYLVFNLWLSGSLLPNTFSAKQTEYAVLQETSLWIRMWNQLQLPLVGAGALLAPGIFYNIIHNIKNRNWLQFAPLLWVIGFMGLYAWRLPVTYQHGRYIMPVMPVWFVLGLVGLFQYLASLKKGSSWVFSRTWIFSLGLVQVIFVFLGARSYAQDVAWIETEMVQASKWIAENTQPDDLIAAHDIGALGFYSQREILDLAGLISPEVVPFLRDEVRLADYLDQKQVDYLMTFPAWYPYLVMDRKIVFTTQSQETNNLDPMTIYQWNSQ